MGFTIYVMGPTIHLEHLNVTNSDHKCLHLELEPCNQSQYIRKPFRFEEIWTTDVGCEDTIQAEWDKVGAGTTMFQVWNKLKDCKRGLGKWSKQHFGNVTRQLAEKRQQLLDAEANAIQGGSLDSLKRLKSEINFLLEKEERMWRQRSRTSWLKDGDRNTRYFHGQASQRRRRNRIMGFQNNEGVWMEENEEMVSILVGYYETIFTTSQPTQIEEAVAHVPHVISSSMNESLTRAYTEIEVEEALKQMAPLKAPGPDGLPPLFYQRYWSVVGQDVTRGVLSCLNSGRLITDNVLVAFETLHHMHTTKMGRDGAMALKLDMSKAYDRVEWNYLESIMRKMGFHTQWISMIMQCISTVSYSILVNGEPHGFLKPSRGLRQGDPLSPYLFLMCAKGFHSLISRASEQGDLQGVALCRRGPRITYLFFADDSLLFTKATTKDCAKLQEILLMYERALGQQVNRDKTTIFFSKATPTGTQETIRDALGVPIIKQYERYLGLPSFVGKNRTACFSQLKERVWSKLMGWKEKLLSQAGREVLIKSVAQAIPTYTMSCFRLPNRLCQDLEAMIRKFWWGHGPDKNKICWVWRLLTDTNSLLYRVFKAKFFPHCSILEADPKSKGSYAWQSILKARDIIKNGIVWRVGNGKTIKIWRQRWLLEDHHRRVITPIPAILADSTVSELISPQTNHWDEPLIDSIFFPYDSMAIKSIPLSESRPEDKPFWPGTKTGQYTVRSGYKFLQTEDMKTQPSCSNLKPTEQMWKELNLKKKHVIEDPTCELCGTLPEDILHALWVCPHAQAAWGEDTELKDIRNSNFQNFMELWCQVGRRDPPIDREVFTYLGGNVCAKILSDPLQLGPRAKTLRQEVHFSYRAQLSDRQELLRLNRNLSQKMTPWHKEHSDGLRSQDHILRTQARLCARPVPLENRVFLTRNKLIREPGHVGKKTHSCMTWNSRIAKILSGSSRNPDRKTALKRTKNTPVASVRGAISHKSKLGFPQTRNLAKLGQICARTGTRFEEKRAGRKTRFSSRTAAFARRVFPARNKLIYEPGCVGKITTPATSWNSRFAESIPRLIGIFTGKVHENSSDTPTSGSHNSLIRTPIHANFIPLERGRRELSGDMLHDPF
uniref:Reverse transcriptase domain-containing protein n=1 Tax=Fagus sylvatica TaxID=28930 RepID=A0A2N9FH09_FAGSY